MSHPVFNPANAVTASRYLCMPPFLYFYDKGWVQLAVATVIVSGLVDKLDGLVARIFDCKSPFGEFFDAITDALSYGFFLAVSVAYGDVSIVPIAILVGLFALNSLFRVIYSKRVGRPTNYHSEAMVRVVGFIAFMAGMIIVGFQVQLYVWFGVGITALVFFHDAKRMLVDPIPEDA